jgi:hypothetical protein
VPPFGREMPSVLEKEVSNLGQGCLEKGTTYIAIVSQLASKVEAKLNMASAPKLRW